MHITGTQPIVLDNWQDPMFSLVYSWRRENTDSCSFLWQQMYHFGTGITPLPMLPAVPAVTKIEIGDKFSKEGVEIVEHDA